MQLAQSTTQMSQRIEQPSLDATPSKCMPFLASCLINAQPLPAHIPAADDNSLIGCTSHDLTDNWSLASSHFGAVWVRWSKCFENNVPFDNTTPIYLINLL